MSDIKKIKDEYLNKLDKDQNIESINQIKTELFGKNGIVSNEFKKLGSVSQEERKKFASDLNFIKEELKDPFSANLNNSFSEFSIICCPLVSRLPNLASSIVCSEIFISSLRTNIS